MTGDRLLVVSHRPGLPSGAGSLLDELLPRLPAGVERVEGPSGSFAERAALELKIRKVAASLRPTHALTTGPSLSLSVPTVRLSGPPEPAPASPLRRRLRRTARSTTLLPPASQGLHGVGTELRPGIDTERFAPSAKPEGGPVRVLFLGRLVPSRGAHAAIEAMHGLPGWAQESAHLDVVGSSEDPVYLERLRGRARGLPVTVHPDVPDTAPYLRRASIALLPATAEDGWGRSVLEAMASGLAVVTSRGVVLDALVGGAALQVPAGNLKELGEALRSLLRRREEREALGERARQRAVSQNDWSVVLPAWTRAVLGR